MKLSLLEQETVLLYNQAESAAEVYTHDPKLMKKLEQLGGKTPGADHQEGRPQLHCPQTLRIGPGAVQRKAAQSRQ